MHDSPAGNAAETSFPTVGAGVDATRRTVETTDGRELTYAEYGARDGDPVVFLHGTPGSRVLGSLYDGRARERGIRVLAPDRPGFGRSTPHSDRRPVDAGSYVEPMLTDAGVSRAGIIGFSGGAADALGAAATRPGLVDRVALVSGAAPPSLATETPRLQRWLGRMAATAPRLLGGLLAVQARIAEHASPAFVVDQYTTDRSDGVPDDAAHAVKRDFVESCARSRSGAVTELAWIGSGWGIAVDEVDVRVRLWHGDRDRNVPLADAERLSDRLSSGELTVLDGADHLTALLRSRSAVLDWMTGP